MLTDTSLRLKLARTATLALLSVLAGLVSCGDDSGANPAADAGTPSGTVARGEVCSADKRCRDGLVCSAGKCAAGAAVTLNVDSAARGCELVVMDEPDAKVTDVRFADGVKGSHVSRAPRTGLSFIPLKDEAIRSEQIVIVVAGDGMPKLERTACVDAKGKALPKAVVSLVK